MLTLGGCNPDPARPAASPPVGEPALTEARSRMVRDQIVARGIADPRVLEAMARVPRHEFVPAAQRGEAYEDWPLPIG